MADLSLDDVSKLKNSSDDVVVRAALAYENLANQVKLIRAEADTAAVNAGVALPHAGGPRDAQLRFIHFLPI